MLHNYDLETAAQMKINIPIAKDGHQKSPAMQKKTPIVIKHPLDSFGLIGCPQCGHFSADFETSLLQAGQVIRSAIDYLLVYIFSVHLVSSTVVKPNFLQTLDRAFACVGCSIYLAVRNETLLCRTAIPPTFDLQL